MHDIWGIWIHWKTLLICQRWGWNHGKVTIWWAFFVGGVEHIQQPEGQSTKRQGHQQGLWRGGMKVWMNFTENNGTTWKHHGVSLFSISFSLSTTVILDSDHHPYSIRKQESPSKPCTCSINPPIQPIHIWISWNNDDYQCVSPSHHHFCCFLIPVVSWLGPVLLANVAMTISHHVTCPW